MSDPSGTDAVRTALERLRARTRGLTSKQVVIRDADFSFRELSAWRDLAFDHVLGLPEVGSLDLDEQENRVILGVTSLERSQEIEETLVGLGVPADALAFETWSEPVLQVSLRDYFRPVRGGFEITTTDEFGRYDSICSLGFNVGQGGADLFTTASHCTVGLWELHQTSGTYQDTIVGGNFLGYEYADPAAADCGGTPCRYSDASFFQYEGDVNFDFGYIARPEGPPSEDNSTGSITIDSEFPRFEITEKGDPIKGVEVDKVGRLTGWTRGSVTDTCVDFDVNHEYKGNTTEVRMLCSHEASYYSKPSDSGAPVFEHLGSNVRLSGIHFGKDLNIDRSYFSPISGIEQDFGAIDVVAGPPPLNVSIDGPEDVKPDYPCTWYADVSGGSGSYSYEWSGVLSGTGSSISGSLSSSGWLFLDVVDSNQNGGSSELHINVSASAPDCGL